MTKTVSASLTPSPSASSAFPYHCQPRDAKSTIVSEPPRMGRVTSRSCTIVGPRPRPSKICSCCHLHSQGQLGVLSDCSRSSDAECEYHCCVRPCSPVQRGTILMERVHAVLKRLNKLETSTPSTTSSSLEHLVNQRRPLDLPPVLPNSTVPTVTQLLMIPSATSVVRFCAEFGESWSLRLASSGLHRVSCTHQW